MSSAVLLGGLAFACAPSTWWHDVSTSTTRCSSPTPNHVRHAPLVTPLTATRPVCMAQSSLGIPNQFEPLPPGTTSLLLRVPTDSPNALNAWLRDWAHVFLFSAQGNLPVPLSLDNEGLDTLLYFYASAGECRGALRLVVVSPYNQADSSHCSGTCVLCVSSSSLFTNPRGTKSATLPGERRIVRALFADIVKEFPADVTVLYKPAYIRLKRNDTVGTRRVSTDVVTALVAVFVADVRGGVASNVKRFVQTWGAQLQFGGTAQGIFATARTPPISAEVLENGLRIRLVSGGRWRGRPCEVEFSVRRRRRGRTLFREKGTHGRQAYDEHQRVSAYTYPEQADKTLVLVSASLPEDGGTRIILKRFSADLRAKFPGSRIHSSQSA